MLVVGMAQQDSPPTGKSITETPDRLPRQTWPSSLTRHTVSQLLVLKQITVVWMCVCQEGLRLSSKQKHGSTSPSLHLPATTPVNHSEKFA